MQTLKRLEALMGADRGHVNIFEINFFYRLETGKLGFNAKKVILKRIKLMECVSLEIDSKNHILQWW